MTSRNFAAGLLGGVFVSLCVATAGQAADPQAGARVFNRCKACHALEAGTSRADGQCRARKIQAQSNNLIIRSYQFAVGRSETIAASRSCGV